jgi:hypothetical protein
MAKPMKGGRKWIRKGKGKRSKETERSRNEGEEVDETRCKEE